MNNAYKIIYESPRVCKLPHISAEPKINLIEEDSKRVYGKKFKNFFRQ